MKVRVYDVSSMSCSYVLAGHTEIVVCLDTCVSSSGKTLVVSGSKDNTVSYDVLSCGIAVELAYSFLGITLITAECFPLLLFLFLM